MPGGRRARAGDQDIPPALQLVFHLTKVLAHIAAQTVARDGVAHLRRSGHADFQFAPFEINQHQMPAGMGLAPPVDMLMLAIAPQRILPPEREGMPTSGHCLCGKHLAAAQTTGAQHIPAALGLHTLTETVDLAPLALFRLVRAIHAKHSFFDLPFS